MTLDREYFEKYKEQLPFSFAHLGMDIDEDYDINSYIEEFAEAAAALTDNNYSIRNGCSRMVLIEDGQDYVLKIPFNGHYYDMTEYNEDSGEYETIDYEFKYFNGAYNCLEYYGYDNMTEEEQNIYDEWVCDDDYCAAELALYEIAKLRKLDAFFPDTQYLGKSKNNVPLYVQEKISVASINGASRTPSDDSKNKAKHMSEAVSPTWIGLAIEDYGEEKVKEFLKFLEKFDMDQDLHNGNIGYNAEGRPVLCDWCGWNK